VRKYPGTLDLGELFPEHVRHTHRGGSLGGDPLGNVFDDNNRLYFGALRSAYSQPADSDVIGSVATVMTWIYVHFRHWNERMSHPLDPGIIRVSIILVVHFGHGGCSAKICEGA
jgi:hypothetical protein